MSTLLQVVSKIDKHAFATEELWVFYEEYSHSREKAYLKCLTEKVELLVRRMRMKVLYHNQDQAQEDEMEFNSYGFKSTGVPPAADCLAAFEEDLYELIRRV